MDEVRRAWREYLLSCSRMCLPGCVTAFPILQYRMKSRVSPVANSILQFSEDRTVQGVNIRQLVENLSESSIIQHGFPVIPDRRPHGFPKVLTRGRVKLISYLKNSVQECFLFIPPPQGNWYHLTAGRHMSYYIEESSNPLQLCSFSGIRSLIWTSHWTGNERAGFVPPSLSLHRC